MPDDKYQCPIDCPHQADDGKLSVALSLISRITLPISTCILVGFLFHSIATKEDRAITQQEFIVGAAALVVSYQPTLMIAVVEAALSKYLKK